MSPKSKKLRRVMITPQRISLTKIAISLRILLTRVKQDSTIIRISQRRTQVQDSREREALEVSGESQRMKSLNLIRRLIRHCTILKLNWTSRRKILMLRLEKVLTNTRTRLRSLARKVCTQVKRVSTTTAMPERTTLKVT